MGKIFHALGLNLHQPAGNLEALLATNEWEAREILFALDRIPRALWGYEDVARVHLSFSGTLLETLSRPEFQERVHGIVKCGELLWHLQNDRIIQKEVRYRPHWARHDGADMVVVVRDRELSYSQESGMDHGWFIHEARERTKFCDFPPLVTTGGDGDNGGWFRNVSPKGNFWGVLYQPLLEQVRRGETELRPTFIDDYLNQHQAQGEVRVRTAAWNTGWHSGVEFTQWTGSGAQKDALRRVAETSQALHEALRKTATLGTGNADALRCLAEAQWRILRAETSCNFFWGETWLPRCHHDLDEAWSHLRQAEKLIS